MLPTGRVIAGEFRELSHRSGQVLRAGPYSNVSAEKQTEDLC